MEKIRVANVSDLDFLSRDIHINLAVLKENIERGYVYIIENKEKSVGWLRYNIFWDNTPFLNMIYVLETYQNQGYGGFALKVWEQEMVAKGYKEVMTSTLVHESSIHFYLKHGYVVVGGFHPSNEEYEVILKKNT